MALKRRSFAEQRVLRLLRLFADRQFTGAARDAEFMRLGFAPAAVRWFKPLAKLATARGYEIKPLLSPYVAAGELRIVGLLAQAQRTNVDQPVTVDGELHEMLMSCAAALDMIGIRLPSLALVSAQLPDPAGSRDAPAPTGEAGRSLQVARRSASSA